MISPRMMFPHLSSSIKALLKYANEARRKEHRAVKWGVAEALRTPVTGRCYLLSRFSIGGREMLTGITGGPPSGNEGQGTKVDTPEWDGRAWSLVEGVGPLIPFDSPSGQSIQEAGIWLHQTLCQTSLPVTVSLHHQAAF